MRAATRLAARVNQAKTAVGASACGAWAGPNAPTALPSGGNAVFTQHVQGQASTSGEGAA
jgi:hypothetical protein